LPKNKIVTRILIGILVVNQLFLIFYNRSLVIKNLRLKNNYDFILSEIGILHVENSLSGISSGKLIKSILPKSKIVEINNKPYTLLLMFKLGGCSSCLSGVVSELNKIYLLNKNKLNVIGVVLDCKDEDPWLIKRQNNIKFTLYCCNNNGDLLKLYKITRTPALFYITNVDRKILFSALSKKEYYKEGNFFERVRNYLSD